ncbi:unnamed protein product [Protopolystoma xenopodis]|uniref:Uncharacterized protein n=1 Tax=Protopolystoma xenopodis TaxID=117903 RepID=A0A3S5C4D3_9PLAT|nr:unnamed protein product [Protopolystoma xenopodis]
MIIEAPTSGPHVLLAEQCGGFGIGLATRGFDVDLDGSPELLVTSWQHQPSLLLFTQASRLVAHCRVSVPPVVTSRDIKAGDRIPVSFLASL